MIVAYQPSTREVDHFTEMSRPSTKTRSLAQWNKMAGFISISNVTYFTHPNNSTAKKNLMRQRFVAARKMEACK